VLASPTNLTSYANNHTDDDLITLGKSLIKILNNSGPSTDPCVTPDNIGIDGDDAD
jgi:hypothetical protein